MNFIDWIKGRINGLAIRRLRASGYSAYAAPIVFNTWYEDLARNRKTSLNEKLWARRRGFASDSIKYYGLTDENYTDYLSDFDYLWLHPINGPYTKWIDDKLSIKYILQPFSRYLPEYYYHIHNREIHKLMDCQGGFQQTTGDVIALLENKHLLAAKLISSSRGKGFHKLAFDGKGYYINNRQVSTATIEELIQGWINAGRDEYIITEYIIAHQLVRKIWDKAPCSLRIIVVRERHQPPRIVASALRIATSTSGVVDSLHAGAVMCIVDVASGYYSKGILRIGSADVECRYHPDTKVLLEGTLPNWDIVKEGLIEVCSYIPQVRYLGFDVLITDDGFRIIEINSLSGIDYFQCFSPFLKNEDTREFFEDLLQEKKAQYKR